MTELESGGGESESAVKVNDRRLFTADGRLREDRAEDLSREDPEPDPGSSPPAGFEHRSLDDPPGVDFTMLINAMAEPALLFLGEIPHPSTGKPAVDLERSRIQIDMLDLLRNKCRGNLSPEEEGLLDRVLYQLRMLYVARDNQPTRP